MKLASKVSFSSTKCNIETIRVNAGGFTAHKAIDSLPQAGSVEELSSMGFRIITCKRESSALLIEDDEGRVVAAVIPSADDPTYEQCIRDASEIIRHAEQRLRGEKAQMSAQHRGDGFTPITVGISYGNGHTQPSNPKLNSLHQEIADSVIESGSFQRIASAQDAAYAKWHPKGYRVYKEELDKLWRQHPNLKTTGFVGSVMPSAAINVGRRVCTKKHKDSRNSPFGWCLVTALGDFDQTKGGHLIMWELKIAVEFPAGTCICLPSALITHSNIPVQPHETRASFTQYCPGEVFRYIENEFQTDTQLRVSDPYRHRLCLARRQSSDRSPQMMFSKKHEVITK